MRRAGLLIWLTALWVILWRDLSVASLAGGALVALIVMIVYPMGPAGDRPHARRQHTVRPVPLLVFLGFFGRELIASNFVLARTTLSPWRRIRTGIIELPLPGVSDLITTLVANAITLTPGTMTIEVHADPRALYIHVLHMAEIEDVRQNLHKMLHLALRAFCTDEALAKIEKAQAEMEAKSGTRTGPLPSADGPDGRGGPGGPEGSNDEEARRQ